jgi:hypothetical protein
MSLLLEPTVIRYLFHFFNKNCRNRQFPLQMMFLNSTHSPKRSYMPVLDKCSRINIEG